MSFSNAEYLHQCKKDLFQSLQFQKQNFNKVYSPHTFKSNDITYTAEFNLLLWQEGVLHILRLEKAHQFTSYSKQSFSPFFYKHIKRNPQLPII